jgi:serine/threonine-protein kinase
VPVRAALESGDLDMNDPKPVEAPAEDWQRVKDLLQGALDREPGAREAFLDQACGGDAGLRRTLDRLLASHERAGDFLQGSALPGLAALLDGEEADLAVGRQLGAYRVVKEIGRGGMGAVYLAERADAEFHKQVAIKLIKRGMDTDSVTRQFRHERQILASLEHPNIARLIDGGTSASGLPFFVMEHVEGVAIDAYCDERRLSISERIELFQEVCAAVSYAHQRLVVHRDLKPSNILVTQDGVPKLLDFGIARIMSAEGGQQTSSTVAGMRLMTPEYASPEQVQGLPATTLSDVYSLGVVLYELLSGHSPYRLPSRSPEHFIPAILDAEPETPSAVITRIEEATTAGGERTTLTPDGVSATREGSPERLRRRLRGDLDTIVLKAMHKEPGRRYASMAELVQDLQRHLTGLPVSARRDSVRYRARKFVRRNRLAVIAGALLFTSLAGGLVASAWQARRARVQEGIARAEQARAEAEARKAGAVKDFLKSLLSAASPEQAQGKERTARQLLEDGAGRIEGELAEQPEVQSEVAGVIADAYYHLGEQEQARRIWTADLERRRRIDGPRSLAVASLLIEIGNTYFEQGRYDQARPHYEEALAIQREQRHDRTPEVAWVLTNLAALTRFRADLAGAEALQKQALEIFTEAKGGDSREAFYVRESLALTYAEGDRFAEAVAMVQPMLPWREGHLGVDHPETLTSRYNHAHYVLWLGRTAEAMNAFQDIIPRQRRVLGPKHDRLARSLRLLARALDEAGRSEAALPVMAEAMAIHREALGPDHVQFAIDRAMQCSIGVRTRLAQLQSECESAVAFFAAHPQAPATWRALALWYAGRGLAQAGRLVEADAVLAAFVAFARSQGEGVYLGRALDALGDVARRRGQVARAVELGRAALAAQERGGGGDSGAMALARAHTGAALWASGQSQEGERELRAGVAWLERSFPQGHFDLATGRVLLGEALARSGRRAEAEPILRDALAWRLVHLGPGDPRVAEVRRLLADARAATRTPSPAASR